MDENEFNCYTQGVPTANRTFYRAREECLKELNGPNDDCYSTLNFIISDIKSYIHSYQVKRECKCFEKFTKLFTYVPIN